MNISTKRTHGPLELLILQSTPFCNLDCSYCYLPDRSDKSRMPIHVIEKAFEFVIGANLVESEFTIVWHAGEPMTLPPSYYKEAFDLSREFANKHNIVIHQSIQTNATLVTDEWCKLIQENDVRVGISLDGSAKWNDRVRVYRSGKGSHQKVLEGIECLRRNNIDFHVISVITSESVADPEGIFDFFHELGIERLGFNFEEQEGENERARWDDSSSAKSERFLESFMKLIKKHNARIQVREFDGIAPWLLQGGKSLEHNQENSAFKITSVSKNGRVSTFSPELLGHTNEEYSNFIVGNLLTDTPNQILNSDVLHRMMDSIDAGIQSCKMECEYFDICGGGSPGNKLFEAGSFAATKTKYCENSVIAPAHAALTVLEDLAQEAKMGMKSK